LKGAPVGQREGGITVHSVQVLEHESNFCRQPQSSEGFLAGLSPEASKAFENIKLAMTYPTGAVLFIESEAPKGVFVLSKGRVKLSLTSANGKVMILRIVKPGEILGLHAVISNVGFQATAETVEPCQINFVGREDFLRFLREQPQAALLVAKQLSARYQETCEQLRALGLSGSAREKVARFLLEWSERGEKRKEGVRARLTLTHEEIGQLIGASRETITRILGDFKGHHWIIIKGSMLVLQNRAALENLLGYEAIPSLGLQSPRTETTGDEQPFLASATGPLVQTKAYSLGVGSSVLRG
jgi:CRP/FNR family transcriptional regulator, cyclic AMP receptor protein